MNQMTIKIDACSQKPHIRHVATIDERGWAHTKCGRKILRYYDADFTSYYWSNGRVYAVPCPRCLPDEAAHA